jgi:hypothetical protein
LKENGPVPQKKYLLNYIYDIETYFVAEKQVELFENKINHIKSYFSDINNAEILIKVLILGNRYYTKEFDFSYQELNKFLSVEDMAKRIVKDEDYIETRYKNIISNIQSMEGFTLQFLKFFIDNTNFEYFLENDIFYLGIPNNIAFIKKSFYFFECELMFSKLNVEELERYISNLYMEEHLEIMQCTYTLSKVKKLDIMTIQKLVVTNPYTKGLKELMTASIEEINEKKMRHFEKAINFLRHIKYYYLEALYFYCLFLKEYNYAEYKLKLSEGLDSSRIFKYQHINYLFENIESNKKNGYTFSYDYYEEPELKSYIAKYRDTWEKIFEEVEI